MDPTKIELKTDDSTDPFVKRMTGVTRLGHKHFDVPFITQITDNLYQGGCENGLVLPDFIKNVVSLYPWEKYTVSDTTHVYEIEMLDDPEQDTSEVDKIAFFVNALRKEGAVLVHCQAGLNRSSLIVARALMLDGMTSEEAIALIREKRSYACLSNDGFESYLRSI